MAWTDIEEARTNAESPIDVALMDTRIRLNLDYLKAVLTDAGSAPQGISTTTLDTTGDVTVGGDANITGSTTVAVDATITGATNTGTFFADEQLLILVNY